MVQALKLNCGYTTPNSSNGNFIGSHTPLKMPSLLLHTTSLEICTLVPNSAITHSEYSTLTLGNNICAHIMSPDNTFVRVGGVDGPVFGIGGLPSGNITFISTSPGQVMFGFDRGFAHLALGSTPAENEWHYYYGSRWLPHVVLLVPFKMRNS